MLICFSGSCGRDVSICLGRMMKFGSLTQIFSCYVVLAIWVQQCAARAVYAQSTVYNPTEPGDLPRLMAAPDKPEWGVQIGVAFISENNIGEIFTGGLEPAEGDAGGEVYLFSLTWIAHRFEIPYRDRVFTPRFEPYLTLALVDENRGSPFPDYNGGIGFRWVDFPWDRWVDTSAFMGVGFSYSSRVFLVDRERHPGEERSHLKLDWPLQLTLAIPRWPEHQLVIFNDHHSGGHIFDQGGVNNVGIGYRLEF